MSINFKFLKNWTLIFQQSCLLYNLLNNKNFASCYLSQLEYYQVWYLHGNINLSAERVKTDSFSSINWKPHSIVVFLFFSAFPIGLSGGLKKIFHIPHTFQQSLFRISLSIIKWMIFEIIIIYRINHKVVFKRQDIGRQL